MGIRTRGFIIALVGLLLGSALFGLTLLAARTVLLNALILLTAIPVLVFLVGLLELISGVSFARIARGWNSAPQLLQIVVAVLVVVALLGIAVLIFMLGQTAATGP